MLLELGAERYIDADALVHQLYTAGQPVTHAIASAFGHDFLATDGSVDRKKLGNLVFQDAQALQQLERIVHPAVTEALRLELAQVSPSGIAIIDAVKLLEGESGRFCQSKWLVLCSQEQQLQRLQLRSNLSAADALVRINAQTPATLKIPLVDEVIDNSGSLDNTRQQVITAFRRFCEKFPA
jgi:dephospho-CoA kinase